jgi:hypothetical protein
LLSVDDPSWLEAEAAGKRVFGKALEANQTKSFAASRQIKILTGNRAGTSITYNGQPIGPLGDGRRVGVFIFTPHGWNPTSARSMAQRSPENVNP